MDISSLEPVIISSTTWRLLRLTRLLPNMVLVCCERTSAMCNEVLTKLSIATKQGAIVGGQTSCKAPEIAAFEKHLPEDVEIISCHSLHGPNVDPRGQPLVTKPSTSNLLYLQQSRFSFNTVPLNQASTKSSTSSPA
jgi:hypothetical protein